MLDSCKSLWDNITNKQIYINGSIGSTPSGEAFKKDYDLPNDTNYSETCAALGMIFFTFKMLQNFEQSCYADTIEYILYNAVLSGLGLDGEHFFYANPMEMLPRRSKDIPERNHLKSVRQQWYACSCWWGVYGRAEKSICSAAKRYPCPSALLLVIHCVSVWLPHSCT